MLKCEQRKQKPPQPSAYSPTYGQHRKTPPFSTLPEKTPRKVAGEVVGEAAEVTAEVAAVEEEEIPLLSQEDPLWVTQVVGEEKIDSSDNPRTSSQEIVPR